MASIYVRALCLDGYAPPGFSFSFLNGPVNLSRFRILNFLQSTSHYLSALKKEIINKNNNSVVYFIKPRSIFLIFVVRFLLRLKIYLDVNDPLHRKEHLGFCSKIRFIHMLKLTHGVVFESDEYRNYCKEWFRGPVKTIEDTPQFEISFINFAKRKRRVLWFGSPATSKMLTQFVSHFIEINRLGFEILLLGADPAVVEYLRSEGADVNSVPEYSHIDLLTEASDSMFCFVPMVHSEEFELRGNLKAKFGMAAGCITIASDLMMHRRLIVHGTDGFLFSNFQQFQQISRLVLKKNLTDLTKIAHNSNKKIMDLHCRERHAKKICEFMFESEI